MNIMRFLQKQHKSPETSRHDRAEDPLSWATQKGWRQWLLPALFFFFLTLLFCSPLLKNLYSSGSGDWDYFMFLYEVPSITLFEYKQFPLWNPYCGGGISLIGNPQAGYLSPILIFTALFGVAAGLKIAVLVHTFAGLWGMWLLSGHLKIKGPARLAPSLIFMFSGAWALHIAAGHIVWLPASLLPLLLLALLKCLDKSYWIFVAGAIESIMFYEGGTYVLAYSLLFICIYCLVLAIETKSFYPLKFFFMINLLAAAFSAPKLLPVLEVLQSHPRPTEVGVGIPLDIFFYFFIDRFTGLERSLNGTGWWAFGCYFGIIVISLYLFSFTLFKRHKALVIVSLFTLLVSLGNFGTLSPWNILHNLPIFSNFQVPTRALIVFSFAVALLCGHSLEHLGKRGSFRSRLMVSLTVLFIFCDLISVSLPTLANATQTLTTPFWKNVRAEQNLNNPELYRIPPSASSGLLQSIPSVHQPFTQISIPFTQRNVHGAWSDQYLPLLQNTGVVDAYETIPFARNSRANTDEEYKGEYYLLNDGTVTLNEWSPNRQRFHIKSEEENKLVINQNFDQGWRSSSGIIVTQNGLLAINIPPGNYDFEVYYLPKSFQLGLYLLVFTLGIFLMVFTKKFILRKKANSRA